ncbi:MAG: Mpo1-like protein [Tatlockia sp.]|jgi:uncharacterized membrane protein YGL010W
MNSFIEQARLYAVNHQKPITRYTHYVGIPLLFFSLILFLSFIHLVIPGVMDITLGLIATLVLIGYYFYLNWRLALALSVILLFSLWIAHLISFDGPGAGALWTFIVTFVLGLSSLFVGHYFEKTTFTKADSFWQALIAPLFFTAELFFLSGYMNSLKGQIEEGKS